MVVLLALLTGVADAGVGPWTLNPREHNVYAGFDHFRYREFRGSSGPSRAVASELAATSITGVWTQGLSTDLELEIRVPVRFVRATDATAPGCVQGRPDDFCDTTLNLGDLAGVLKWRIVDELYRSPVSVSLDVGLRSGEFYAPERGRLTAIGPGTTDLALGGSVGKTGALGQGWYTTSLDLRYYYRFPHAGGFFERDKVPADEIVFSTEALVALHPRFAFGPAVFGFTRLGGTDFAEIDFFDENGFASLDGAQVKVGGKLAVFGTDGGPTVSFTLARTVWARNNPTDTLAVSAGVGWFFPRRVRLLDG